MNERIMDIFKRLNGDFDEKNEGTLSLILDILLVKVKSYCNIENISEELEYIIAEMLSEYYKTNIKLSSDVTSSSGEIKAITRGSTKIEYNVSSNISSTNSDINDILNKYKRDLRHFRRIGVVR